MKNPIRFTSTRSQIDPVGFDTAVLQGFARDGGLFVPESLPQFTTDDLKSMADLCYTDLAFYILSRFIDPAIIPASDLIALIRDSFDSFDHPDILPLIPSPEDPSILIMELFHGPTLSFKDIAMGFLIRVMDYLLQKQNQHLNLVLATTGDTGPAAAHASMGKQTIDCWPLFPLGMVTPEQERQMTTLDAANVHPMGVKNCPDGGDDLDRVVLNLFSNKNLVKSLGLSSVNSINWCRVMVQSVHYFYGYFKACSKLGDPIVFSVLSGAFGNLFAGYLAREMGLPVTGFICATNSNKTLHRVFTTGHFLKKDLIPTLSSAIDIVVPYNFWRFLYFAANRNTEKINRWMDQFNKTGEVILDPSTLAVIQQGFSSISISDELTLETIQNMYSGQYRYLLDPHGAVAMAGAVALKATYPERTKIICLATAHPAKFPDIAARALDLGPNNEDLPRDAVHPSMDQNSQAREKVHICDLEHLETKLIQAMSRGMNPELTQDTGHTHG